MIEKFKSTAKQSIVYSIGNITSKLSGLILLPIYSTYITIGDYGLLALFDIIFDILVGISFWGMNTALPRWYHTKECEGKQSSLFFTTATFLFIVNLLFCAASFSILFFFDHIVFSTDIDSKTLIIFGLSCVTRIAFQTPLLLMRIQHKATQQTTYQIINLVLLVSFISLFLVVFKMGIEGIFLAQLISSSLAFLATLPYFKKNITLKFEFGLLREMIQFGTPLLFSNMVFLILALSDRYILAFSSSLAQTGEYQLATRVCNIINLIIVQSFMSAFTNVYYKDMEKSETNRFFAKSMTYFVLVGTFLSLGLNLFSREALQILSLNNPDYMNAYRIIPFLVFASVFGGMRQFVALPLFKHKKTKITSSIAILSGLINVGLNLLFIPRWGAYAAAINITFSQFLVTSLYYLALRKTEAVNLEVRKIIILFVLSFGLFLVSLTFTDLNFYIRLVLKIALFIAFPVILYLSGFFETVEMERVKLYIKKIKLSKSK